MKVYETNQPCYQRHMVVADSLQEAITLHEEVYGKGSVTRIEKICDYVIVQGLGNIMKEGGDD